MDLVLLGLLSGAFAASKWRIGGDLAADRRGAAAVRRLRRRLPLGRRAVDRRAQPRQRRLAARLPPARRSPPGCPATESGPPRPAPTAAGSSSRSRWRPSGSRCWRSAASSRSAPPRSASASPASSRSWSASLITFDQNRRMLIASQEEAVTDALTGLANRRALMADLERAVSATPPRVDGPRAVSTSTASRPTTTASATRPATTCCAASAASWPRRWPPTAVATGSAATSSASSPRPATLSAEAICDAAEDALSDRGQGFSIGASWGKVLIPVEVVNPERRAADRRPADVRAEGPARRLGAAARPAASCCGVLHEREPELERHLDGVAQPRRRPSAASSRSTAKSATCSSAPPSCTTSARSRSPTRSSTRTASSTTEEWKLMRKHPLIGQRVLEAAPGARRGREARPLDPRALGRQRLPRRPRRPRHPARLARDPDLRRLQRDDRRPPLPRARCATSRRWRSCAAGAGTQFDPELVKTFAEKVMPALERERYGSPSVNQPAESASPA